MKIEIISLSIGLVHTKIKLVNKVRKSFVRNGKLIKAKKYKKPISVPIKNPFLSYQITLSVNEKFVIGGVYAGNNNGERYMCTSVMTVSEPQSILRNCSTTTKDNKFILPNGLTLMEQQPIA